MGATRRRYQPEQFPRGSAIVLSATALVCGIVSAGLSIQSGDGVLFGLMMFIMGGFAGFIAGTFGTQAYEFLASLGLDGRWNVVSIPISMVLGVAALLAGLAVVFGMLFGVIGIGLIFLGMAMGSTEMVNHTTNLFLGNLYGQISLALGAIGFVFGMAPRDPYA